MTDQIAKASALFRRFFGKAPKKQDILEFDGERETVLVIGELDGVIYRTSDSKEPYIHRFAKSNRPLLSVSFDGSQIYILKGGYRFTAKGFIG
ncbi:MAG: hypothetical protein KGJ13_05025 [Patescibacteria group bacterium]|nr:hypothetical protein [Patescibacteria group bacterium]